MPKFVLYIHDGSHVQEVSFVNTARGFAEFGYELVGLSVLDPQAEPKLKALLHERRDELLCYCSSNFWALNIRNGDALLHTLTGIPLVIYMQDHPLYFLHQLSPSLNGAIFFVPGDEAADFVAKHYPLSVTCVSYPGFLPNDASDWPAPDFEQFMTRKNMVLAPMNLAIGGETMDDTWAAIAELPQARCMRARRLIDAAVADCTTPLHMVSERLAQSGDPELAVEDMRLVLRYVKLWRRTRLAEMLVDLPILWCSAYVPAELQRRHPDKFVQLTRPETMPLYSQYRFVANSSPLLTDCIHERVSDALLNNAVVVTDRSAILERYFGEREMVFAEFSTGDLASRVQALMDDPQAAFERTLNARRASAAQRISSDAVAHLIATVQAERSS